jgi:transcriptional regulator of acetoin/glycerol metabolism
LTDRFAREGLRVLGRPVGIEQTAYARLIDYRFPGEDAELTSIVQRLVARCTGDLVRAADVEALRLRSEPTGERRKDPLSA